MVLTLCLTWPCYLVCVPFGVCECWTSITETHHLMTKQSGSPDRAILLCGHPGSMIDQTVVRAFSQPVLVVGHLGPTQQCYALLHSPLEHHAELEACQRLTRSRCERPGKVAL